MNSLVQCLVASLREEIKSAEKFVDDAESMMLVELLRAYLDRDCSSIITPENFKFYVLLLTDFCDKERGSTQDTMEQLWEQNLGNITWLRHLIKELDSEPQKSQFLTGNYSGEGRDTPLIAPWGIAQDYDIESDRSTPLKEIGSNISCATLYNFELNQQTEYNELRAKARHVPGHYYALTNWDGQWYECNDARIVIRDSRAMSSFEQRDVGLFHRKTGVSKLRHEAQELGLAVVMAAAASVAAAAGERQRLQMGVKHETRAAVMAAVAAVASTAHVSEIGLDLDTFERLENDEVAIRFAGADKCVAVQEQDNIDWHDVRFELVLVDCVRRLVERREAIWNVVHVDVDDDDAKRYFQLRNDVSGTYLRFKPPEWSPKNSKVADVDGDGDDDDDRCTWIRKMRSLYVNETSNVCLLQRVHFGIEREAEKEKPNTFAAMLAVLGETVTTKDYFGHDTEFEMICAN